MAYSMLWNSPVMATSCSIQSWPPTEVAEYIRNTRTAAQAINSKYPNICWTKSIPPTENLDKILSTLDKATDQAPLMDNIWVDFTYNVLTVFRLETSPIVIKHWKMFYDLEKNTLLPTLESLAAKCQLSGPAESEIIWLIQYNNQIQEYFKNTVIWNIWAWSTPLEKSIADNYTQAATLGCKDDLDLSTVIEKATKKSEWLWSDITKAKERWDEALRLMRWESSKWKGSYDVMQTKLLRQELSRQWLGKNAMQQMLKNLSCAQAEWDETIDITKQSLNAEKCKRNYVIWYEKVAKTLDNLKWKAKSSDEYIYIEVKNKIKITDDVDVLSVYNNLENSLYAENNADATSTAIITNLLGIHTNLVWINLAIEKRIPKMKENCMKWSPDTVGWC